MSEAKVLIEIWRKDYNETRPHGALNGLSPSVYTVLNEGANKGILVTTSDFGPNSYSFATGKPLTLFNRDNLLLLLEKHGHKAKIDLVEANK